MTLTSQRAVDAVAVADRPMLAPVTDTACRRHVHRAGLESVRSASAIR